MRPQRQRKTDRRFVSETGPGVDGTFADVDTCGAGAPPRRDALGTFTVTVGGFERRGFIISSSALASGISEWRQIVYAIGSATPVAEFELAVPVVAIARAPPSVCITCALPVAEFELAVPVPARVSACPSCWRAIGAGPGAELPLAIGRIVATAREIATAVP